MKSLTFVDKKKRPQQTTTMSLTQYAVLACLLALAHAQPKPFVGVDKSNNLVLNNTQGDVHVNANNFIVNGVDLVSMLGNVVTSIQALDAKLDKHIRETRSPTSKPTTFNPTTSPTPAPTTFDPTTSPTTSPTVSPTEDFNVKVVYNGQTYNKDGATFTINGGQRKVQTLKVSGTGYLLVEAAGAEGGNGIFSGSNDPGAPGGVIRSKIPIDIKVPQTLYAFVAERTFVPTSNNRLAGAGGGSTDLRSYYTGSLTSVTSATFLNKFLEKQSLDSRWIVGGGGGGAHGDHYVSFC